MSRGRDPRRAVFALRAFHPLRVKRVALVAAEACSIAFEVPPELSGLFSYEAGQFVHMGQELAGKVAIVTGGANGIGRATVELFVEEGA